MLNAKILQQSFADHFNGKPVAIVRAPGRVNLIGEHTDYNEGFVLPMAIDQAIWFALRPREDARVTVHSRDLGQTVSFDLRNLHRQGGWIEYIKGVAHELLESGHVLKGWEGIVMGDVPQGAGLSSSAALELASARAFAAVSGLAWEPRHMARLAQRAENEWVGLNCGIMDHMASAASTAGHALFLDCRSLETQHVPLPTGVSVVVLDTSTRRELVDSAYNERREQCDAAARFFGVRALRDVSVEQFRTRADEMPDRTVMRRARHIITEDQRVLDSVEAMRRGDLVRLGQLFDESHASLRDDLEVTNEALNQIVSAAQAQPECYGARMTGAGFGGCAVALVRSEAVMGFKEAVSSAYQRSSGLDAKIYVCQPSAGASLEKTDA